MSQPTGIGGRPFTPAPGSPTPELRIARFRPHARRLFWSALVLIAVAAIVGWLWGNLPAPFEDWMLLAIACIVVLVLVLLPFAAWWSHVYTLTTRRIMERRGILRVQRRELVHVRGYTIQRRRGPIQRLWRTGTLTLSNGIDEPMRLRNIPSVDLVHEALVDQVEVSQILAHRDATSIPVASSEP
jgi:membrane protein YdbS with pleckstrin-like domain